MEAFAKKKSLLSILIGEASLTEIENFRFYPDSTNDQLVKVMVVVDGQPVEYEAYAVRGMDLEQYLSSKEEKQKASLFANGWFAFPERDDEENAVAYRLSTYAYEVIQTLKEQSAEERRQKYHSFSQNGGEARKQAIRGHYEELRPIFDEIVSDNPDVTDYQLAKKLNELGHQTVSGKEWHNSSAQGMREYLQNDPAYSLRGKSR